MANTLENAGKGAVAGAAIGSAVGPVDAITGANIGTVLGALGGLGGLADFGKAHHLRAAGSSGGTVETSGRNFNNMNQLARMWNSDNPNNYVGNATKYWENIYGGGRSSSGRKKEEVHEAHYGINPNTGNQALDRYANYLLGGGTQGADKWLEGQRVNYSNAMKDAAKTAVSGYIDPYITGQQGYVDNALESAYQESLDKIKAQKAYGYLSDVGYQKALDKLNTQRGIVGSNMNDAYAALVYRGDDSWQKHLNDMYNEAIGNIKGWDWVNPFDAEGGEYSRQNALAQNYARNSINDDIINSLLADTNTFTPEEWIAYGAGNQGQYNPFIDFIPYSGRKKRTTSTEGINEV